MKNETVVKYLANEALSKLNGDIYNDMQKLRTSIAAQDDIETVELNMDCLKESFDEIRELVFMLAE